MDMKEEFVRLYAMSYFENIAMEKFIEDTAGNFDYDGGGDVGDDLTEVMRSAYDKVFNRPK